MTRICPVILCGGAGTRLWPASRPERPKQFISLLGGRTLFQSTLERMAPLGPIVVVAGKSYCGEIERQAHEVSVPIVVLAEPTGRDSGPAIAAAANWIASEYPDALAAVVASDHHIPDGQTFRSAIMAASHAAERGYVVTFGVQPTAPQTAYGYIQPGDPLGSSSAVRQLKRFVEKPDAATAVGYVEDGYLWNSGNFLFHAETLADDLRRAAPELTAAVEAALGSAERRGDCVLLGDAFSSAPKISFDYAFMETAERAAVAPVSYAWSDLGAWDSVWEASPRDGDGNTVSGDTRLVGARDCLIRCDDGPVVVGVGLKRIAVVADKDAVLVCDLDSAQGVKTAVEALGGRAVAAPATLELDLGHWLRASALPVWWTLGADHIRGGFHECLDLKGRPVASRRRVRVQARQIYAFATAGAMGWDGPWRTAVRHGLDYLLARYRRDDGLFRTLVTAEGAPADEATPLYDQAFVLLALASAARALPDQAERMSRLAEGLRNTLRRDRAHNAGGFVETVGPSPFQANPLMHLLEASMAWEEVADHASQWRLLSDHLVELCLTWLIDPETGALREVFDATWAPLDGTVGHTVEPGHQFEWAWLLERWARMRRTHLARHTARRLFEVGERGVDPRTGAAASALLDDLTLRDPATRLWPQTERIKAAAILAETETDPARWSAYRAAEAEARRALGAFLEVPTPGLWRDKLSAEGRFTEEPAPGSSFYHIVCAVQELERVAEAERRPSAGTRAPANDDWTRGKTRERKRDRDGLGQSSPGLQV